MKNRGFTKLLFVLALMLCFTTSGFAAEDWKAKQEEMFSKIGLKPGDTIDASNWEKAKDILPPSMVEWVKKGDLPITIGEFKFDASPEDAWKRASAANAGKYMINESGELIDVKTNEVAKYIYGEPFPDIDEKDSTAGSQLVYNYEIRKARVGTWNARFGMQWIGRGGFEKKIVGDFLVYYYMSRPDGEQHNPQGFIELSLFPVIKPYDVRGLIQLNRKSLSQKADDVYAYIPAIRRVKKLSGANRSDPSVGSDFILDDSNGWGGKNTSMSWTLLEKKVILVPMTKWGLEAPLKARQKPNGSWEVDPSKEPPKEGYLVPEFKGAPWIPTNILWAPRELFVVEAKAKDQYYNYGKTIFYMDPAMGFSHKVIFNKALEYWKTMFLIPLIAELGEGDQYQMNLGSAIAWYGSVDDKAEHATTAPCYGNYQGEAYSTIYMDPDLIPTMYAPNQIATMTR